MNITLEQMREFYGPDLTIGEATNHVARLKDSAAVFGELGKADGTLSGDKALLRWAKKAGCAYRFVSDYGSPRTLSWEPADTEDPICEVAAYRLHPDCQVVEDERKGKASGAAKTIAILQAIQKDDDAPNGEPELSPENRAIVEQGIQEAKDGDFVDGPDLSGEPEIDYIERTANSSPPVAKNATTEPGGEAGDTP